MVGPGVGVEQPDDAGLTVTTSYHGVGVVVEPEHRRDGVHAVRDGAVEEDAAVAAEGGGEEELCAVEARRQQQSPEEAAEGHAVRTVVARVGVDVAFGVVELVLGGVDDDVVVCRFAEVDLGRVISSSGTALTGGISRTRRLGSPSSPTSLTGLSASP